MRRLLSALALVASALVPHEVVADAGPHIPSGWYLPIGFNIGGVTHANSAGGAVLGAEASIVNLGRSAFWAGAYGDALWDTQRGTARMTIGPELGFAIFGVDGGFVAEVGNGRVDKGFAVRPVITFGVLALYGRWVHLLNDTNQQDFGEFGLLFKFPVPVATEPDVPRAIPAGPYLRPDGPASRPGGNPPYPSPAPTPAPMPAAAPSSDAEAPQAPLVPR